MHLVLPCLLSTFAVRVLLVHVSIRGKKTRRTGEECIVSARVQAYCGFAKKYIAGLENCIGACSL